jgi:hypothetical protein
VERLDYSERSADWHLKRVCQIFLTSPEVMLHEAKLILRYSYRCLSRECQEESSLLYQMVLKPKSLQANLFVQESEASKLVVVGLVVYP